MTGMFRSRPIASSSLNPSMSGICTSLNTISTSSFFVRSILSASVALLKVVTVNGHHHDTHEHNTHTHRARTRVILSSRQKELYGLYHRIFRSYTSSIRMDSHGGRIEERQEEEKKAAVVQRRSAP